MPWIKTAFFYWHTEEILNNLEIMNFGIKKQICSYSKFLYYFFLSVFISSFYLFIFQEIYRRTFSRYLDLRRNKKFMFIYFEHPQILPCFVYNSNVWFPLFPISDKIPVIFVARRTVQYMWYSLNKNTVKNINWVSVTNKISIVNCWCLFFYWLKGRLLFYEFKSILM